MNILIGGILSLLSGVYCLACGITWEKGRRFRVTLENGLKLNGVTTVGQLDERRTEGFFVYLTYSYEYQGNRYQGIQKTTRKAFKAWGKENAVLVRYLLEEPEMSILENIQWKPSVSELRVNAVSLFTFGAFLILSSILVFMGILIPS